VQAFIHYWPSCLYNKGMRLFWTSIPLMGSGQKTGRTDGSVQSKIRFVQMALIKKSPLTRSERVSGHAQIN